ncbi:MAG: hypothetical protein ABF264_09135 [Flavobacteriales bacterium]|jgi:hypothetical protein
MKQILLYISFFLILCNVGFSQLPAQQENQAGFRSEWFGGLILHTNGWGGNLTRAKFKTYKKYNLYSIDFVNIKDPKEYKIRYQVAQNSFSKAFKYGKLNSLYNTRLSFGQQYMIYEKLREKGVSIYFNWKTGANLGLLKPIYLEIVNQEDGIPFNSQERYDPIIHNESNIYGKGQFGSGFNEINLIFGGHFETGFKFELAKQRENIFAVETGLTIDVFPAGAPILAFKKDEVVLYNLYIKLLFGKKYFD